MKRTIAIQLEVGSAQRTECGDCPFNAIDWLGGEPDGRRICTCPTWDQHEIGTGVRHSACVDAGFLLTREYDRGRVAGRADIDQYSDALGRIESALGIHEGTPMYETIDAVAAAVRRAEAAEAEVERLRKTQDDAGLDEHNVLALIAQYRTMALAAEQRERAIRGLLEAHGCDCACGCDGDGHDADCEPCLACKIELEMLGDEPRKLLPTNRMK